MTPLTIDLSANIGPLFVGMLFFYVLYGITLAQTAFYWRQHWRDSPLLRALVAILALLDATKAILDGLMFWNYLINNHGNVSGLSAITVVFGSQNVLAWTTVLIAQHFYIYNLYVLLNFQVGRRFAIPVAAISALLAFFGFAAGMGLVYELYAKTKDMSATKRTTNSGVVQSAGTLATDAWITVVLSWTLYRARSEYKTTQGLLSRLITFTVERGIILTVLQAVILATFLYDARGAVISDVFYFAQSSLYCNCVLAVLNLRRRSREAPPDALISDRGDMLSDMYSSSAA